MKLGDSKAIKTAQWFPNEIMRDTDINFLNQSTYLNLVDRWAAVHEKKIAAAKDVLIGGLRVIHDTLMTVHLQAGAAISPQGKYFQNDLWGFVSDPGAVFGVIVPVDQDIAFDNGGTYDRMDMIEIRPIQLDYNSVSRNFKDPVTGLVTTAVVKTRKEYGYEFAVRKGNGNLPIAREKWMWTVAAGTTGAALSGKYILLNSPTQGYYAWFDTDGSGTDPLVSGRVGIPILVGSADPADVVANYAAMELLNYFGVNDNTIAFSNDMGERTILAELKSFHNVVDATNGDTGALFDAIAIYTQGNGAAPRTAGWIKIAEVLIPASATSISDVNIFGVDRADLWMENTGILVLPGEIKNTKTLSVDDTGRGLDGAGHRMPPGGRLFRFDDSYNDQYNTEPPWTKSNAGFRGMRAPYRRGLSTIYPASSGYISGPQPLPSQGNWTMDMQMDLMALPGSLTELISWLNRPGSAVLGTKQDVVSTTAAQTVDMVFLTPTLAVLTYGVNPINVIAGTLSGGVFTWGSPQTFAAGLTIARRVKIERLDDTHFAIGYMAYQATAYVRVLAGSVSGTTITLGAEQTVESAATFTVGASIAALTPTKIVVHSCLTGISQIGTITGVSVSLGASSSANIGDAADLTRVSDTEFVLVRRSGEAWYANYGSESGGTITWDNDRVLGACANVSSGEWILVSSSAGFFVSVESEAGSVPRAVAFTIGSGQFSAGPVLQIAASNANYLNGHLVMEGTLVLVPGGNLGYVYSLALNTSALELTLAASINSGSVNNRIQTVAKATSTMFYIGVDFSTDGFPDTYPLSLDEESWVLSVDATNFRLEAFSKSVSKGYVTVPARVGNNYLLIGSVTANAVFYLRANGSASSFANNLVLYGNGVLTISLVSGTVKVAIADLMFAYEGESLVTSGEESNHYSRGLPWSLYDVEADMVAKVPITGKLVVDRGLDFPDGEAITLDEGAVPPIMVGTMYGRLVGMSPFRHEIKRLLTSPVASLSEMLVRRMDSNYVVVHLGALNGTLMVMRYSGIPIVQSGTFRNTYGAGFVPQGTLFVLSAQLLGTAYAMGATGVIAYRAVFNDPLLAAPTGPITVDAAMTTSGFNVDSIQLTDQKFILTYGDASTRYLICGEDVGGTFVFGSRVALSPSVTMSYLCKIDSSTFVVVAGQNSYVCTVSGNVITVNAAYPLPLTTAASKVTHAALGDKFVVAFASGNLVVGVRSGTAIRFGKPRAYGPASVSSIELTGDSGGFQVVDTSGNGTYLVGHIRSDLTIAIITSVFGTTVSTAVGMSISKLDARRALIAYAVAGIYPEVVLHTEYTPVGIYTRKQRLVTSGMVKDTYSGMNAGEYYYVHRDGSLKLLSELNSEFLSGRKIRVGRALRNNLFNMEMLEG